MTGDSKLCRIATAPLAPDYRRNPAIAEINRRGIDCAAVANQNAGSYNAANNALIRQGLMGLQRQSPAPAIRAPINCQQQHIGGGVYQTTCQ